MKIPLATMFSKQSKSVSTDQEATRALSLNKVKASRLESQSVIRGWSSQCKPPVIRVILIKQITSFTNIFYIEIIIYFQSKYLYIEDTTEEFDIGKNPKSYI